MYSAFSNSIVMDCLIYSSIPLQREHQSQDILTAGSKGTLVNDTNAPTFFGYPIVNGLNILYIPCIVMRFQKVGPMHATSNPLDTDEPNIGGDIL